MSVSMYELGGAIGRLGDKQAEATRELAGEVRQLRELLASLADEQRQRYAPPLVDQPRRRWWQRRAVA